MQKQNITPHRHSPRGKTERHCIHCGCLFYVFPHTVAEGKAKYCSRACADAAKKHSPEIAAELFWQQVKRGLADECWNWQGKIISESGHGRVSMSGRLQQAHRVAYSLACGPIPKGQQIRHTCDNAPCCNPQHLILGTQAQNMADMKARNRSARHQRNGNGKLTLEQKKEIQRLYSVGDISMAKLAAIYGVVPGTICFVIHTNLSD